MSKNSHTHRDELVCGKLDRLCTLQTKPEAMDLIADIRHDCERMEAKLVARKDEVELLNRRLLARFWNERG